MVVQPASPTKHTEQAIENLSFDDEFRTSVIEGLGYDGTNLVRIAVASDGSLKIT